MKSSQFIVHLKSTPKADLPRIQPISVSIINGKLLAGDKQIIATEQAQLTIERDLTKETIVSVKVGNDYQNIDLPPAPNTIKIEVRRSNPQYDDQYGGQGHKEHTLCVEIPNNEQDAAIIPNTMQLEKSLIEANMGSVDINNLSETPRNACALVVGHLGSAQGRVRGTATLSAEVAKVVVSEFASSSVQASVAQPE
jgi:hypothetical protein